MLRAFALLDWPILNWELVRTVRRPWPHLLRWGFAAWVVFLLHGLLLELPFGERPRSGGKSNAGASQEGAAVRMREIAAMTACGKHCVLLIFRHLLLLVLLLPPLLTAGALGHEKEQDTLLALLG